MNRKKDKCEDVKKDTKIIKCGEEGKKGAGTTQGGPEARWKRLGKLWGLTVRRSAKE